MNIVQENFEGYTICCELHKLRVEFHVFQIVGWLKEDAQRLLYLKKDSIDPYETVEEIMNAEKCIHGYVKWDGCSNWDFHTDEVLMHFCGRRAAMAFGKVLDRMYQIAREKLEAYDLSIAEGC